MQLIKSFRIKSFRSLKDVAVNSVGDFNTIAGLNNSGKSNVLRALNLFFNDETDPGTPIDLSKDFHQPSKNSRRKQEISIKVSFSLPKEFKFHKSISNVASIIGSNEFEVTKTWSLKQQAPILTLNSSLLSLDETRSIEKFISLIKFRYINNRFDPIALIRSQHTDYQAMIKRRLALTKKDQQKILNDFSEAASNISSIISSDFSKRFKSISKVTLKTPDSIAGFLLEIGAVLQEDVCNTDDSYHGSGIQSLLMLELLLMLDSDYARHFWLEASYYMGYRRT